MASATLLITQSSELGLSEADSNLLTVTANISGLLYREMASLTQEYRSCSFNLRLRCWQTQAQDSKTEQNEFHPPPDAKYTTMEYSSHSMLARFGLLSGKLLFGAMHPYFPALYFCNPTVVEKLIRRLRQIFRRARVQGKGIILD